MEEKLPWEEVKEREKNFYNINDNIDNSFYMKLHELLLDIEVDVKRLHGSKKEILNLIFSQVYDFTIHNNPQYAIFNRDTPIYNATFDVCFFLTLCMFLFYTKRADNMSLRNFIYNHSPQEYCKYGSVNYFDIKHFKRESAKGQNILSEDTRLRQYRNRFLSKKQVYEPSCEGSAMKKVSEHEWTLYYKLENASEDIRRTFKAFSTLYNEINTAMNSSIDENYISRLTSAYEKFLSKAQKIKYANFLEMNKFFIEHINEEKQYYGINLYRLENTLHLNQITKEVKQLLKCKNNNERDIILSSSLRSNNIIFPNIQELLRDFKNIKMYIQTLDSFKNAVIYTSRLIIDKFIDLNVFENDWFSFFLDTINELAEKVLYNPKDVDYSIDDNSQEMFYCIIVFPVYYETFNMIKLAKYMEFPETEDDI